ncbi:MAG: sterol desaturase family protein [Acidimicrobiales bacterium]
MTQDIDRLVAAMERVAGGMENVIIPLLAIELVWLWRSGRLNKKRLKEMAANISSLIVIIPAGFIGLVLWYTIFEAIRSVLPFAIPANWLTVAACLLVVDLIYYAEHRFEHTHRLPWDLYHSVHHSSPEFDQTTSLRLSGFDALLTMGFLTPAVLIGFHPLLVLGSYGLVVAYQTWIHTEVIKRTPRWFEYVFNTASHHRVHHGADSEYLDTNYGGILILWDRLFGTFQRELHRPTYGLTTQIESSHPVDVQFSEIRRLWAELRHDSDWSTRLRRLWNPPGWQPKSLGVEGQEPANAR